MQPLIPSPIYTGDMEYWLAHILIPWVTSEGLLDLTNESIEHPVKFEIQMNNK